MSRYGRCKAINVDGTHCHNPALGNGYCWVPRHKAMYREVPHQFQLDGINTANTHQKPVCVPLTASQKQGGRKCIEQARKALEANKPKSPDPMARYVRTGPLTINTVGNIALINKENSK